MRETLKETEIPEEVAKYLAKSIAETTLIAFETMSAEQQQASYQIVLIGRRQINSVVAKLATELLQNSFTEAKVTWQQYSWNVSVSVTP